MIKFPVTADRDEIFDADGILVARAFAPLAEGDGVDRLIAATERADAIAEAMNAMPGGIRALQETVARLPEAFAAYRRDNYRDEGSAGLDLHDAEGDVLDAAAALCGYEYDDHGWRKKGGEA